MKITLTLERYVCPKCHMSIGSVGGSMKVGPLSCWQTDCPGREPQRPDLSVVPPPPDS